MSEPQWQITRQVVSIHGQISDAASGRPLAGAVVEILSGPAAFQRQIEAKGSDPAWLRLADRWDRTTSASDGSFYFQNLPPGDYQLRASMPALGSRYGSATSPALQVQSGRDNGRVHTVRAEMALPPTRIHGRITRSNNGQPIAGATVGLRGDTRIASSDDNGDYELADIQAGEPRVLARAPGFEPAEEAVVLAAGANETVNLSLAPA